MKKGFTLIELLAVIAILGIIAVITTPIIVNFIQSSRQKAFIDTGYSIISSARVYQTKAAASNKPLQLSVTYPNGQNVKLIQTKGNLPDSGTFCIDEDGKTRLALWNEQSKGCIKKDYNQKKITIDKDVKEKAECTTTCSFNEESNV